MAENQQIARRNFGVAVKIRFRADDWRKAEVFSVGDMYSRAPQLAEHIVHQVVDFVGDGDYSGFRLVIVENGKVARVDMAAYQTKTNRRRLTNAYSNKSPLVACLAPTKESEFVMYSEGNRALSVKSSLLTSKPTRDNQGIQIMKLKSTDKISSVAYLSESPIKEASRYRARSFPAAGALLKDSDSGDPTFLGE